MSWRGLTSLDGNEEMVKGFKTASTITTKDVENAFLNVPRAAFLPEDLLDEAYSDRPIRGDDHLHMSAPHMYATVLEALQLKTGMSFLNIGSGTGYFSMLAGFIIGTHGVNHGIELRSNLVEDANDCCDEFFIYMPKMKKQICYPQFMVGNCFHIDPMAQEYDRVYCGAACPQNKVEFLLKLVKPGGFVIVPTENQLMKVVHNSSTGGKETILSDVCFESLVFPDNTQTCPKLRFAGIKVKKRKIKVYPPPGFLVAKKSARKLLARLRALQDVIDCLAKSRCLPKAFAYVPSFDQFSQLTKKTIKSKDLQPVEQTIHFFNPKSFDKKEEDVLGDYLNRPKENEDVWNHIQNDTIWESVLEYTYSLSNPNKHHQSCVDVYTKQKRKKKKKSITLENSGSVNKNGPSLLKNSLEKVLNQETNSSSCNLLKCKHDESSGTNCLRNRMSYHVLVSKSGGELVKSTQRCRENLTKDGTLPCHSRYEIDETICPDLNGKSNVNSSRKLSNLTPDNMGINAEKNYTKSTGTTAESSKSKKNCSKVDNTGSYKHLWPVEVDKQQTNNMQMAPGPNWTADEDNQLVQLLINSFGCNTTKMNNKCLSKHISIHPSLFSTSVLVRYPKLSSYSPIVLTNRALVLFRIVQIIDYVIPYLCSTSSVSMTKPMVETPYILTSFTESSFNSPLSQQICSPDEPSENEGDKTCTLEYINAQQKERLQQTIDFQKDLQSEYKAQIQLIEEKLVLLHHIGSHISEIQQLVSNHKGENYLIEKGLEFAKERQLTEQASAKLCQIESHIPQIQQYVNNVQQVEHLETLGKHSEFSKEKLNNQASAQQNPQNERSLHDDREIYKLIEKQRKLQQHLERTIDAIEKVNNVPLQTGRREVSPHRYNAAAILSNLTFLLPLSSRRIGILTELLRATEQPFSDRIPVLYIDRRVALSERLRNPKKSVFYQIYEEFKSESMNFRCNKRKCDQWWEVKFVGEGIIDQGGGFRDSLAELSDELCPQEATINNVLPLLVRSVNQRDKVGEFRDCFVPNPSCKDMNIFNWLGMLMGAAYRSDESLTLSFPPFVWKLLVGDHVTWCSDFAGVDEVTVNVVNNIELVSEGEYNQMYSRDLDFTTALSDGSVIEIKEGQALVKFNDRMEYCKLVKKTRMMEFANQVKSMRDGLLSVVPQPLLDLITFQELERGVCGFNEISIALLKESIHYGDDLLPDSDCVLQLWKVLEGFTMEDRSRFLRFVSGRKRLPACITLSQMCGEKDTLPSASTCASTLMLPSYSSVQVAEKKLRYAIYNCVAIDTDTNPW